MALTARDPIMLLRERKRLAVLVEDFAPDVVHAHDVGANLWALLRNRLAAPLLTTLHSTATSLDLAQRGPIAATLRESDSVTGVSHAVVAGALDLEPSLAGRISVIKNGLPAPAAPSPRDPATKRVICIGRSVTQKGFDIAVRAFPAVLEAHPEARLVFAGDGPERPSLEALAGSLRIADRVEFLGVVRHEEIAGLLASAAIVALPSRCEGMPLTALEAAGAARPVVATAITSLAEAVVHGVTGTVVAPEDPAALAAALSELLGDPARARAFGLAAHRRVLAEHSLAACVAGYDALLHRLAAAAATRVAR